MFNGPAPSGYQQISNGTDYNRQTDTYNTGDPELDAFLNEHSDAVDDIAARYGADQHSAKWMQIADFLMSLKADEFGGDSAAFEQFVRDLLGVDASAFGGFDELTEGLDELVMDGKASSYSEALGMIKELESATIPRDRKSTRLNSVTQ